MMREPERDPYRGRSPREIAAYNPFEASHYLRVPENTIRNWASGYSYGTRGGKLAQTKPLVRIADQRHHLFSFVNLLELHVISALRRDHNVHMSKIRRAIEYLEAPILRVCGFDTPFPYTLEHVYMPDSRRVLDAVEKVARF